MLSRLFTFSCVLVGTALVALPACTRGSKSRTSTLPAYFVTNEFAGGALREVLHTTNGLSMYYSASNICIWFREDVSMVVIFDPAALLPMKTLLDVWAVDGRPAQSVYDSNADGIPEFRRLTGRMQTELFYKGEWYPRRKLGNKTYMLVDGKEIEVRYDGSRWVTNFESQPGGNEKGKILSSPDAFPGP